MADEDKAAMQPYETADEDPASAGRPDMETNAGQSGGRGLTLIRILVRKAATFMAASR